MSMIVSESPPHPQEMKYSQIWAPGEPASSGDCVIMDADSDFLARVVDCGSPYRTLCQALSE